MKILEIGGGTGGTSSFVLPLLPAERTSYVFVTDISPLFVSRAKERFAERLRLLFDSEYRAGSPGARLARRGFDVVIAANVLHATADLKTTLAHIRTLLKPGGVILSA